MKNLVRLAIISALFGVFALRCANPGSLDGGPRDSLPPLIVRTSPANYTTNFNGKKITLEFDEYIQLKDQSKLFFVSPPRDKKPRLTIKGKTIEILFEEPLDSAQTYRLDFGSSIVDNNEGNKLEGFSFVFSTGGYIDSMVMAGQAVGAYERDSVANALVFFYDPLAQKQSTRTEKLLKIPASDSLTLQDSLTLRDSLTLGNLFANADSTIYNGRAEVLVRTDSSGYFIADILRDKPYQIYAIDDTNGNQKYEPGTDRIGFLEKTFNPSELPGFTMIYDSARRYMKIDPLQVRFDLFKEKPLRRQLISKQERPQRQKMILTFNSSTTVFDSLELQGIDPSWIIPERGTVGDSLTLWIAPPTKEDVENLKDSIVGTFRLQRQDSIWQDYMSKEKLTFWHLKPKPELSRAERRALSATEKEQSTATDSTKRDPVPTKKLSKRELKRLEGQKKTTPADTTKAPPKGEIEGETEEKADSTATKSKLSFRTIAEQTLNPENHIVFEFDYPLRNVDTSKIQLIHKQKITTGRGRDIKEETKETTGTFTINRSPNSLTRWVLRSEWRSGDQYKLSILPRAFEDITFETNDSLASEFTIAQPDKFGEVKLQISPPVVVDSTKEGLYIYELVSFGGKEGYKIVSRRRGIKITDRELSFAYLKPGNYMLRVVEDRNGNDRWDTGSLTTREQPERARMVTDPASGENVILIVKENWVIDQRVDLENIFK